MKYRSWHLLSIAFGALLLLLLGSGMTLYHRVGEMRGEIIGIQQASQVMEVSLTDLREHVFSLALLTRDFLMHEGPLQFSTDRRELLKRRQALVQDLDQMRKVLPLRDTVEVDRIADIVNAYLRATGAVFSWSADEKRYRGREYIREQLTPQRDALLRAIGELNALSNSLIARRQSRILATHALIQSTTRNTVAVTALLSALIAAFTVYRLRRLEMEADHQRAQLKRDQEHLRRLSHELVRAQEEERKSLSRELHDQVGQTLTALRMEVGNLGALRGEDGDEFEEHLDAAKQLSEQALHTVRDLSMGLRPSMLDDLGLEPAIRWQARNFTRSSRIPVELNIEGSLNTLPEAHRISVFRIVQEALTNCAKHAGAHEVRITLHGTPEQLSLTIQDDGRGFTRRVEAPGGVGLIGIEERIRELGGTFSVYSAPGRGTLLQAELPLPAPANDEQNSNLVGR